MLNSSRIFLYRSFLPILFVLFLLWRLNEGDSTVKPVEFHMSSNSQQLYRQYLDTTCRKSPSDHFTNDDYLNWEENAFFQELRTALAPETSDGDLSSLYGKPEFHLFDYRILSARETSLCEKFNDTEMKKQIEETEEKAQFHDAIINRVFNIPD